MAETTVGAEIRRLRVAQGRTLRHVAAVAKIDFGYLGKVERGANASMPVYQAIAGALGTHLSVLFAPTGHPRFVRRPAARHPIRQVPQSSE